MSHTLTRVRSWWQQLAAIMIKEGKQVTRDPSSWIIAVVLPLTSLFVCGCGFSLDTPVVKSAMLREEGGGAARAFPVALPGSKWSLVVPPTDRRSGEPLLQDQTFRAVVIIPAEFGRRLYAQ